MCYRVQDDEKLPFHILSCVTTHKVHTCGERHRETIGFLHGSVFFAACALRKKDAAKGFISLSGV